MFITNRFFRQITSCVCGIVMTLSANSCNSGNNDAIGRMVAELNSPEFQEKEIATGLYTGSSASVDGDTLTITFVCAPFLNLSAITSDKIPQLQATTVQEFRVNMANKSLKEGIETLRDNGKGLLLVWKDTSGNTVRIPISPSEILPPQQ